MNLDEAFEALKKFPHGDIVGRRMVQLLSAALDDEALAPSAEKILNGIAASEEVLLKRTDWEVHREGSVINYFKKAMLASSNEEWDEFKQALGVPPLSEQDRWKLFEYAGSIRGKDFLEWVMGNSAEGGVGRKEIR